MASLSTCRNELHEACLRMVADGLVIGSAGNISVRLDASRIVVSAGGVPYTKLTPADHPVVSLNDGTIYGQRKPSSELALHLAIMRAMPDVEAIVHTHSPYASAFAVARFDLRWICNENMGARSERIMVTKPYASPGSDDLGRVAVATLNRQPGSRACLLANHGPVAIGPSLDDAYLIAHQVEWVAMVTHRAAALGEAHVLTPRQQNSIGATYGFTVAREDSADDSDSAGDEAGEA